MWQGTVESVRERLPRSVEAITVRVGDRAVVVLADRLDELAAALVLAAEVGRLHAGLRDHAPRVRPHPPWRRTLHRSG